MYFLAHVPYKYFEIMFYMHAQVLSEPTTGFMDL